MSDRTAKPAKILVVDDDPAICELLVDALGAGGMTVAHASSVAGAVEMALKARPDMIVTDLRLGDGTGLDVIDTIREQLGDIPAVVITGHGDPLSLSEASRRRPVELINKPIDLTRLRAAIDDELDRQRRHQRLQRRHRRLRELTRQISHERRHAYKLLCSTCDDLTATCRNLQGHMNRQEALIRYQTTLLGADEQDDVFRHLFRLFVERTGVVFGVALLGDETDAFQLVGRFGVPVPDGVNFCSTLAMAAVPVLEGNPEVTVMDATDNIELFPESIRRLLVGVTLLLIPLLTESRHLIGTVVLYRKGEQPFTDDDITLAEMISIPTAAAVLKAA